MKNILFVLLFLIVSLSFHVYADETVSESMQDIKNDAQREAKQKMNRLEEETCMKSETECLRLKAENRLEETSEAISDKYDEIKNVIDND
ncbi:hypothetical protein [Nitrosomonas sp.]|uniref:hypothetical protein n=1 Tax=Nitrosomonas sp. TaxID=42353 RepID=UPI00283B4E3F|nr:hypothetical protein [Nitrosomonas sp.]MCP5242365.1 hypothetical protein [Burkholderiales bacterium]MDR4514637.1 hypothetical protein [Nitrosomonas sp.]